MSKIVLGVMIITVLSFGNGYGSGNTSDDPEKILSRQTIKKKPYADMTPEEKVQYYGDAKSFSDLLKDWNPITPWIDLVKAILKK